MSANLAGPVIVSLLFAALVTWLVSAPGRSAMADVARELAVPVLRRLAKRPSPDYGRIRMLEAQEELARLRAERLALMLELAALRAERATMTATANERRGDVGRRPGDG